MAFYQLWELVCPISEIAIGCDQGFFFPPFFIFMIYILIIYYILGVLSSLCPDARSQTLPSPRCGLGPPGGWRALLTRLHSQHGYEPSSLASFNPPLNDRAL